MISFNLKFFLTFKNLYMALWFTIFIIAGKDEYCLANWAILYFTIFLVRDLWKWYLKYNIYCISLIILLRFHFVNLLILNNYPYFCHRMIVIVSIHYCRYISYQRRYLIQNVLRWKLESLNQFLKKVWIYAARIWVWTTEL
jgi:hypothetical protein